jgi:putative transposase
VALHRAGQGSPELVEGPQQNGYVESFNGRLRDECLNETLFVSLGHARSMLRLWRDDYNHVRPHSGIGGLTPADVARRVVQHCPEGHHTNPGPQL